MPEAGHIDTELAVIGGGPGGYVAAIRAADLGADCVLVEERERLGGVCLLEGCIPSKALLSAVEIANNAREAAHFGISVTGMGIDVDVLRARTASVVDNLTRGVSDLVRRRGIRVVHGRAAFESPHSLSVAGGSIHVGFRQCIIATGSRSIRLGACGDLPVWTAADALALPEVPGRLLVVGGGYIGLELGLVYAGLGSAVTLVELTPALLPGTDEDLVRVVARSIRKRFASVLLESRLADISCAGGRFAAMVERKGRTEVIMADRVLVAVGRTPNTGGLGLEQAGLAADPRGLVEVDDRCRTAVPHIFAIGDVTPGPMLAHRASRQGKVAAEVAMGQNSSYRGDACPAVVFTDPEIAVVGLTEREAASRGIAVEVSRFNFGALGRALAMGRTDGHVKIVTEPGTRKLLGVGIVGPHASELIAEATLAVESAMTAGDLARTIHPHPTLSEALMEAAEVVGGTAVHVRRQFVSTVPPGRARE